MKFFLATAFERPAHNPLGHFQELQRQDRVGEHQLAESAAAADVILFVDPHLHGHGGDWRLSAIRRHQLTKQYLQKVLVYDERDDPWPDLPGVYVSLPQPIFDATRHRAGAYPCLMNELVGDATQSDATRDATENATPDLLFSFVGSMTHPVRAEIYKLQHPRALVEKNLVNMFVDGADAQVLDRKRQFAEIVERSKFVLCPRGMGTASIRMFESLRAGRVPVVISDDWVAPNGPQWSEFSLRVRESEVARLPQMLEENEARFEAMSEAARRAYDEWFAPDILWHRIAQSCEQLMPIAAPPAFDARRTAYLMRFCARNLTTRARVRAGALKQKLKR